MRAPERSERARGPIEGVWSDPPDVGVRLVQHACTPDWCVIGGQRDTVPVLFRYRAGQPLQSFHVLPPPERYGSTWAGLDLGPVEPWVAMDPRGDQVSATRVEYQGGSWGVVVFPDASTPQTQTIPSTTDSDIPFGVPHVLRGDELFTLEPGGTGGALWQFRRASGRWSPTEVLLPRGEHTDLGWDLVVSDDGQHLFLVSHDAGVRIERFARGADHRFRHDGHISLPAIGNLAGASNDALVFVFEKPQPDGSLVWLLDPRTGATRQTLTFPMNGNPSASLHRAVYQDGLLISQQRNVMLVSLVPGIPPVHLTIPAPPGGRFELLAAEFMGDHAVVLCNNRVGVFDLRRRTE